MGKRADNWLQPLQLLASKADGIIQGWTQSGIYIFKELFILMIERLKDLLHPGY